MSPYRLMAARVVGCLLAFFSCVGCHRPSGGRGVWWNRLHDRTGESLGEWLAEELDIHQRVQHGRVLRRQPEAFEGIVEVRPGRLRASRRMQDVELSCD